MEFAWSVMRSWVAVVVVVVIVLTVGFAREHWRVTRIRRWCKTRGFEYEVPTPPADAAILTALAGRFRPGNVKQLGVVLRGTIDGVETIIAEHAESWPRQGVRWHTIVATRTPGAHFDAVHLFEAPSRVVAPVTDVVTAPGRALQDQLGIEVEPRPQSHRVGETRWALEVEEDRLVSHWSSDPRVSLVDGWTRGGALVSYRDYVAWRLRGLLKPGRLDDLLNGAREARSLFQRAGGLAAAQAGGGVY